ncbi:PREDICTED: tetraspanin-1-like [Nanorana parkeri]|uniref:tetraspanin-1-like n=1 Tax=Nanorana parkeri TaxID=125878 RepID=UPI00085494F6|nr:PREDICTED: tetraspanin-1-like [Nanorana parkeri]
MSCFSFLKKMMFIFNGIIYVGGVTVLGVGIWVKVDGGSFLKILVSAAPQLMQLVNVGYLCIAVGGFLMVMGFLGCYGAVKESRCMLMIFFIIVLIIFIVEMVGAVVVLAFSSLSKIFIDYLGNAAVKYLRNDYGQNNELTTVWNSTMKEMKCCGFNGYKDFINSTYYRNNNEFPPICCAKLRPCQESSISSQIKGCLLAFEYFLGQNGKIVGGVALVICGLEFAAMMVALMLFRHIKKE